MRSYPCIRISPSMTRRPMSRLMGYLLFFLSITTIISGCDSLPKEADKTQDWSAGQLYEEAKQERKVGNYMKAIDYYQKLESRYPFGRYAQQAQLETIYTYYKADEPDLAIASADRFMKLYPRHEHVDYAHYIRGITNFDLGKGPLDQYLPVDPSQRDPGAALHAFQDFGELIERFPESKYAPDARQRMLYLRNNLAKYEVHVANYYLRRKAYIACANRGKYVIEHYQGAPAVADALVIMAKAYKLLGTEELSEEALRVLEFNFPDHPGIAEVKAMVPEK
uniref:Outer membrane protein assembly factor BamD n=1 Tax=Candidatus Kentrum sp. FM TaxID=2126340 RepID=A0A450TEP1_9GAMM|nr:MAG: outer membrane protein assembly factor BamD [Candidatus Kentron sp. FM]VFJ67501.1 MAG: outer membrane protein assembly factor BamD [Candidatus Kentron sp. FM]VFK13357.1 MAG: outer membrane protein assembly factor BamD [Candidatus Kentron sp. FM]